MGRSIFVITFEEQRFLMRLPWTYFYHYKVCCLEGKSIEFVVIMKSEGRCRIKSEDARGTAAPNTLSCIKKQRNGRA